MTAISKENKAFLAALLSAIHETSAEGMPCGSVPCDADEISIPELCGYLEALKENPAALERMWRLFRYEEWCAFYDYLKSMEIGVDMWPMPSFDMQLISLYCNLVRTVNERNDDPDFAYLYACILFDMAYEEIYQESLRDGIYTYVYQKADKAVAVLISAWEKEPSTNTFIRVLWGYRHKRKCHSVEYSEPICPGWHPTPWVDEEIRCFLKSESVTEEYRMLPECIQILQLIENAGTL